MNLIKSLGLCLLLALAAHGEGRTKRQTLVQLPYGTVYCEDTCTPRDTGGGERFAVTTPQGPVKVSVTQPWLLIQSARHLIRVRQTEVDGGLETLVQLDKVSYRILRHPSGEVEWTFPDDKVYFRIKEGTLRDAVGRQGSLEIHRNTQADSYTVSSEAGSSEYHVDVQGMGKRKRVRLKTLSGEPPGKHTYLLKGVAFQNGSVGVFIPLSGGKLLSALDAESVRRIAVSEPTEPEAAPAPTTPVKGKPLEADPPTQGILNASPTDRKQDPLNLGAKKNELPDPNSDPIGTKTKKNPDPTHDDLLRANTPTRVKGAPDPLRVREIDPLAPNQ